MSRLVAECLLKEIMTMNRNELNIFFHNLANGEGDSFTIKETSLFRAILDIDPITEGHILILPKRNVIEIGELSEKEVISLHKLIKQITKLLHQKYSLTGVSIMQNGGQNNELNYLHIHLIPRHEKDGFGWKSKSVKVNLKQVHKKIVSK